MIKKRVKTGVKTHIDRRPGWGPGGCLAFWVPEMQGGRAAAGVMVCRGWLGGGDPAAICGGDSAVFNSAINNFPCCCNGLESSCVLSVFLLPILAVSAWPMMTGGPRPGCAAAAPGPGCGRQAGRQVLGEG